MSKPSGTNYPKTFRVYTSSVRFLLCVLRQCAKTITFGGYGAGVHLFPFRTEKLSPLAPMVLQYNAGE